MVDHELLKGIGHLFPAIPEVRQCLSLPSSPAPMACAHMMVRGSPAAGDWRMTGLQAPPFAHSQSWHPQTTKQACICADVLVFGQHCCSFGTFLCLVLPNSSRRDTLMRLRHTPNRQAASRQSARTHASFRDELREETRRSLYPERQDFVASTC